MKGKNGKKQGWTLLPFWRTVRVARGEDHLQDGQEGMDPE